MQEGYPDSKVLIWNLENDTLGYIDLSNGAIHSPKVELRERNDSERNTVHKESVFKDQVISVFVYI